MEGSRSDTTLHREIDKRCPSSRKVLVIAAYASGRRTICACIAELGHQAIEATAADEPWLIAALSEIDMIIAAYDDDVSCSLLTQLHARDPGIPILMLSTYAKRSAIVPENAILLAEPLTLKILERAIEMMSRNRWPSIGRS